MNYKYKGLEIRPIMKEMLVGDEKPLTKKRFVICEVIGDNVNYPFKTIGDLACLAEVGWKYVEEIPSNKPRTIEDGLKYGDVIINNIGTKRKILGVCNDVIMVSNINRFKSAHTIFTLDELINSNYKFDNQEEPKEVEVTIEDIAKIKGVDPKLIRIKD